MTETRVGKYGRLFATWINYTINTFPEYQREKYRIDLIKELKKYSLVPKRKGESLNQGYVWELEDIINLDVKNPKELAKFVKEGMHLTYLKQSTSQRILKALLEYL